MIRKLEQKWRYNNSPLRYGPRLYHLGLSREALIDLLGPDVFERQAREDRIVREHNEQYECERYYDNLLDWE